MGQNSFVCVPPAEGLRQMIINEKLRDTHNGRLGKHRLRRRVQKLPSDNYTRHYDRCDQHWNTSAESHATQTEDISAQRNREVSSSNQLEGRAG